MTYDELINEFGTQDAIAKAIGVTQSAVANWKSRGRIPFHCQYLLEKATRRRLKMDDINLPGGINEEIEIDEEKL